MKCDYFGNTSLRVKQLLYNFETQLILFNELFLKASDEDAWSNDSELQIRYLELLKAHNLIDNKNQKTSLGTKDARVKSAPLEDLNLIKRKEKVITPQGYELLRLMQEQSYKINNDFLQIDLISLFFLKAELNFTKSPNLLQKYLEIFKEFKGEMSLEHFTLLPLINNFENAQEFIKSLNENNIIADCINKDDLSCFLKDLENKNLKLYYFKTAKGNETAISIISVLNEVFLPLRESKNIKDKDIQKLESLLSPQCDEKFSSFKKLYLPYLSTATKKEEKLQEIYNFVCAGDIKEFGEKFYNFIMQTRLRKNLNDYCDLNRRYLKLTGIFEFEKDKVSLNLVFKMILEHCKYNEILQKIRMGKVSKYLLSEYFDDSEFKRFFKEYNISNYKDLRDYKQNADKERLQNLIETHFGKDNIIEILNLFDDRKNDDLIMKKVSTEATIPTIFEYIIAIAWYYIDDKNLEAILSAGLSLDSNLLPKSHAIGGSADFKYGYNDHILMIEVSLTQKANQRRAEMESVSRHLGNILLELDEQTKGKSFGIFIAPYLDKNVLNDFRSRIYCYFENNTNAIKGMNILPFSTKDIIEILKSNRSYKDLIPHFYKFFDSKNDWGSKWYEKEILPFINSLKSSNV